MKISVVVQFGRLQGQKTIALGDWQKGKKEQLFEDDEAKAKL